jgi:hypothetical protein
MLTGDAMAVWPQGRLDTGSSGCSAVHTLDERLHGLFSEFLCSFITNKKHYFQSAEALKRTSS